MTIVHAQALLKLGVGVSAHLDVCHYPHALPEPVCEKYKCNKMIDSPDDAAPAKASAVTASTTQAGASDICRRLPARGLTSGRQTPRAHPRSAGPWSRAAGKHADVRGWLHDSSARYAVS